jgi:ribosomal protein S18 acetylase RimI-like enzyme
MVIRPRALDHPDSGALIAAVQAEYVVRYGGEDADSMDPGLFAPPRGLFLVGYVDGLPVASGGWRCVGPDDDPALHRGDAQLKRMFVVAEHRERGLARALLAELERTAAIAGRRRMVLETGSMQPEAIGLYESSGYSRTSRFGHYRDAPNAHHYAKLLAVRATQGAAERRG